MKLSKKQIKSFPLFETTEQEKKLLRIIECELILNSPKRSIYLCANLDLFFGSNWNYEACSLLNKISAVLSHEKFLHKYLGFSATCLTLQEHRLLRRYWINLLLNFKL